MGTALVTGVAGFIGCAVAEAFLDAGMDVVGVDAMRDTYPTALKRDNVRGLLADPRFSFVERDLAHEQVTDLVAGVEVVSHHAGRAGLRDSWQAPFGTYLDDNLAATKNLLDAVAGEARIRQVVVASSSSVYGEAAAFPTREDALPVPLSPYGVTKLAAERLSVAYAAERGVPVVCLRYFSVFGPRQRPDMAFSRMIAAATGGPPFPLLGDGDQLRDYTYVGDVAAANLACSRTDLAPGTVLNIAGGAHADVLTALDVVAEVVGSSVPLKRRPSAPGEARRTGADTSAARAVLDWTPRTGLRAGIEAQHDAFLAQRSRLDPR